MNKLLLFIETLPLIFLCIVFFFLYLLFFIVQYIYISINLKGICKLMFNDEKAYKIPLTPFYFYTLCCLPLVFWRETLNIKKGTNFKKLYGKEFYYPMSKTQLKKILNRYPRMFHIQYLIFLFGILWFILCCFIYISEKYL